MNGIMCRTRADGTSPCVSDRTDDAVLVETFAPSQRGALASVLRVMDDEGVDWTIWREGTKERYACGTKIFAGTAMRWASGRHEDGEGCGRGDSWSESKPWVMDSVCVEAI